MKLTTYLTSDRGYHIGAISDGTIVNLHHASNGELPDDMLGFLEMGEHAMGIARAAVESAGAGIPMESIQLAAPVTNPSKVVAIGLNYMDHVRETGMAMPELATMFCKYPSAITAPGSDIRWSTALTSKVDYEAELAVVIGKTARNVIEADAYNYIAGYTNCNDVSARDLQLRKGDQWLRGKCLDTFCPLGPYLVTRDEIPDPHALSIRCLVNGQAMQESNTSEMIYSIPYLIEYLSAAFTLVPGDIIITGTPHGVGAFRVPPIWLKNGDEVTVSITGLGDLTNRCVEE
jgi:2-keto-4-pentenoate hydratase/2-oxohepta-3-ene-1,7-dioic acid hydratase in catechol pathway